MANCYDPKIAMQLFDYAFGKKLESSDNCQVTGMIALLSNLGQFSRSKSENIVHRGGNKVPIYKRSKLEKTVLLLAWRDRRSYA